MYLRRSEVELFEGFEVRWCYELPSNPDGTVEHDLAKFRSRDFADREMARAFAREVLPAANYGCVHIRAFTIEPVDTKHPNVMERVYDESDFEEISD